MAFEAGRDAFLLAARKMPYDVRWGGFDQKFVFYWAYSVSHGVCLRDADLPNNMILSLSLSLSLLSLSHSRVDMHNDAPYIIVSAHACMCGWVGSLR